MERAGASMQKPSRVRRFFSFTIFRVMVQDVFLLTGTALVDNFSYYQVEVRPDSIEAYRFYSRSGQPVVNDSLGTVDSTIFEAGLYWVRLSVINTAGRVSEPACAISRNLSRLAGS